MDKRPVVLVVDDDVTLRLLAREALEQEGFTVEEAGDGMTALDQASRLKPDLILLDVQMPLMDGFEVCSRIRSDVSLMHTPLLLVTGLDDVRSIETAYRLGATNFVTKPIHWNTLAYDVRYVLRNSRLEADLRTATRCAEDSLAALNLESSERMRTEGELQTSEIRYRRLFEEARDGIALLDLQTAKITDANGSFANMMGYERTALLGRKLSDIRPLRNIAACRTVLSGLQTAEHVRFEHWSLETKGGISLEVEFEAAVHEVDGAKVVQCNFRDITERKQAETRIRYMALHDALTGLPNRTLLHEQLSYMIRGASRKDKHVAVLLLDLDLFKRVNDSLGHHIGDGLLEAVAMRLRNRLRGSDIVSRLGGDEFVVGLPELSGKGDAASVARDILETLSKPYDVEGHELHVGGSIGISLYPADGVEPGTLLRAADTAMYEAKERGRGGFQFFSPALNDAAQRRHTLTNDLRQASERGEFVLHYQPLLDADSGATTGVEALIRWQHPRDGLVPPNQFIPLLEETGLIVEVGQWVLQTACMQSVRWQAEGLPAVRVAVNLSAYQFYRGDIVGTVRRALHESGLRPALLELELTESLTLNDAERAIQIMHEFRQLGVSLSLDDFGTGWSSLAYLRRFPLDRIKIDRSFIRDVATDPRAAALVRSIISLAKNLGLNSIAEGVETSEQLRYLKKQKCAEVQGFLFSPALPEPEIRAWLRSTHKGNRLCGAA
jgi:diguanylate cyclase (GGDEF)-like protein/PAS domain S-box-containing protein